MSSDSVASARGSRGDILAGSIFATALDAYRAVAIYAFFSKKNRHKYITYNDKAHIGVVWQCNIRVCFQRSHLFCIWTTKKMENGSILLAPQCSVRSWWDPESGIKPSCLRGDSNPDLSQQSGSTRLFGRFNTPAVTSVLNPSTKQAHKVMTLDNSLLIRVNMFRK